MTLVRPASFAGVAFAAVLAASALTLAGCPGEERPAVEVGRALFRDPDFSPSSFNRFACSTCHADSDPDPEGRLLPGFSMVGAAKRQSYWGGAEAELIDAVNFCLVYFMRGVALPATDPEGRALYEYLVSLAPGPESPGLPFTVVHNISELGLPGNPVRGQTLYNTACLGCHGTLRDGRGKLDPKSLILPDEAVADYNKKFPGVSHRLIVTEKLRHGQFFGVGGVMPLFAPELLSDEQIADILAYLGL